jgi:hypothetical protein
MRATEISEARGFYNLRNPAPPPRKQAKAGRQTYGVHGKMVTDPTYQDGATEIMRGPPSGDIFQSGTMKKTYQALCDILNKNGTPFTYIGSCINKYGLQQFIFVSENLIWEKYVGSQQAGAQNRVYVANTVMNTSDFISMTPESQAIYLSASSKPITEWNITEKVRVFFNRDVIKMPNGEYSIKGNIYYAKRKATDFPIPEISYFDGDMNFSENRLTSLSSFPKIFNGSLSVRENAITTLEGCPQGIDELYLYKNSITTLKGCPEGLKVLSISSNPLVSLEGCPTSLKKLEISTPNQISLVPVPQNCIVKNYGARLNPTEWIKFLLADIGTNGGLDTFLTGHEEVNQILNNDRVNGKIPRELIPGKINELRDMK